jgi:hypothetical protein
MWKWLALAVVFAVAQTPVPTSGQTPSQNTTEGHKQSTPADRGEHPAGDAPAIPPNADAGGANQTHPNQGADGDDHSTIFVSESTPVPETWHWWEIAGLIVNFAVACVAIRGVFIALDTLGKLERQTKASEKNAEALIRSERAWITVKAEGDILCGTFKAIASNQGRTPATVISWEYGYDFTSPEKNWELPPTPIYFSPMPWMRGILIAPQNHFPAVHSPEAIYNALISRASPLDQLCIYGRITYWDTFSERTEADKPCETRWCFRFRSDVRDYIPYGGEYDRAT